MTQPDAQVSEGGARPRHPLTVLTLAGSQEDMGRQHGELVAARGGFEPVLDYYAQMPGRTIGTAELPAPARGLAHLAFDRLLRRLDAERLNGMVQYNAFPPNAPQPRIRAFAERYRAKYNEEAHGFAAQSYDGLMVAAAALRAAGTTTDGRKLREALARIRHDGVIGPIAFDAEGQANPPVYVTQWCADGRRRILYPAELAADCGAG